jgi:hypothetical protein
VGAATGSAWARAGSLPGLGSGRIWQVAFNPSNSLQAAAATDAGVYVSADGGRTWAASGLHGAVLSVAYDPYLSPEALFAGLQGSGGIRVSQDGGITWSDDSTGLPSRYVRCIVASPAGLAAGTNDGVAFSSTGQSWYSGGLSGNSVSALGVVANPPTAVFYAGIDYPKTAGGYLFGFAAGGSGGWTTLSTGLPSGAVVSAIAIGPPPPGAANPILVATSKGAYLSTNGGRAWTQSQGLPTAGAITDASFSPLDPNLVYAGADAGGSSGGGLWRSTDGGQDFQGFTQGLPTSHPQGEAPPQEVESLAVAQGAPYPTVLAALNLYQQPAAIYWQLDATAPTPPALATVSGTVQALPASPVSTPTPTPKPGSGTSPRPTSSPSLAAQVVGAVFHFPLPLLIWVILVGAAVFLWLRWRRSHYISGPL